MKRLLYIVCLIEWHLIHTSSAYRKQKFVSFARWQERELQDMINDSIDYKHKWYFFMIEYIKEKESITF